MVLATFGYENRDLNRLPQMVLATLVAKIVNSIVGMLEEECAPAGC